MNAIVFGISAATLVAGCAAFSWLAHAFTRRHHMLKAAGKRIDALSKAEWEILAKYLTHDEFAFVLKKLNAYRAGTLIERDAPTVRDTIAHFHYLNQKDSIL